MKRKGRAVSVVVAVSLAAGWGVWFFFLRQPPFRVAPILALYDAARDYGNLQIRYPFPGSVFPPDIAAPTIQWQDSSGQANGWLVRLDFQDEGGPLCFLTETPQWTPGEVDWKIIKERSLEKTAQVTVLGVDRAHLRAVLSSAQVAIRTSHDEVGAPIFYREVNLPFADAVKDPSRIRWRFGSISRAAIPPVVLGNVPVCGNCHTFSRDGATMGLDVDYANDKGSYALLSVTPHMVLDPAKIITWSDFRREDREPTFGLLSAVSPDGRYAASTVKDRSVFVATEDLAYSQLFFPIKGIIAIYNRQKGQFHSLPGADDARFVQSNPAWSPDGKYLLFARSQAYHLRAQRTNQNVLLTREECQEFLKEGKTFLFDLYRIPFNDGRGGRAEPLPGAAHNGLSNYFARYSPNGRWIVFCRARSFMLLQPDSELYLVPAEGGAARRLSCNLPGMNSWHSWSPNSKWLVFSSKTFTPYTQLFLTHIDDQGESTPPVVLSWFTSPDRAANIPEFVNLAPDAIQSIEAKYLGDYNFVRLGREALADGDLERTENACHKALALNPHSAEALWVLGIVQGRRGRHAEAGQCFTQALKSDPKNVEAHIDLGLVLDHFHRLPEAVTHYRQALQLQPERTAVRRLLGFDLIQIGKYEEAIEQLAVVLRLDPRDVWAEYYLGLAYQGLGQLDRAAASFGNVLKRQSDFAGPGRPGLDS